jgi:hypothetical protein
MIITFLLFLSYAWYSQSMISVTLVVTLAIDIFDKTKEDDDNEVAVIEDEEEEEEEDDDDEEEEEETVEVEKNRV